MSHFYSNRPQVPRVSFRPSDEDRPARQPRRRDIPRYKVVLLHESFNDLMFVVRSLMELTRFPRAEATHHMWEAHHRGRSVLLVTYRERAELFVEQFAGKGLTVAIEPLGV